ncbi:tripartite ATP-independent transporter DctM subunit [Peptoniphilus koenoeneniae]|uniref:Tripartite ATP-independent transporter DctM subunit n=1 Tax=Peptoniphilus koenoeneniae TaxID=507751 RepID=A0ABU0AWL0_9FIRM|nr:MULTISPECIES: TRAP transporter large permease [Peptoniphilus]ERT59714.1 TRAP transporter, DctM subunit [Peptoniphilus sp. BV3C26]MDQ0275657.1 tripartite ATP-independent transporter DctM subunit [Peptoniphilus koenoeneniae]
MTILIILFIGLLIINMPIAFVIGISGISYFVTSNAIPLSVAVQRVVSQTQSFAFLAVPFFVFAGNLMNETGITDRLLRLSRLLTRTLAGGVAQVSVILSTLMGGVSGSAVADAAMEARILGPEMDAKGYPKGYSAAVICLTSLITATIPPSLGLILYGFVGEVSIGRLFAAGIVPGILMMTFLMVTVSITSKKHGYDLPEPNIEKASAKEILEDLKTSIWALIFPIILIVGIRFGIFTPSEAGAFAVVYALIIGVFVYKELTWEKFKMSVVNTVIDNGAIILIISFSGIFSYVLTYVNAPTVLSGFLVGISSNGKVLTLIMLLFLFFTGMIVDSNVNILLLTPIFLPVVQSLGIDPVHFGVCMMTIVTMGCMTPPVGTACYIVCGIMGISISDYVKHSIPFFVAVILLDIVLVLFPQLVLFVPNLIFN